MPTPIALTSPADDYSLTAEAQASDPNTIVVEGYTTTTAGAPNIRVTRAANVRVTRGGNTRVTRGNIVVRVPRIPTNAILLTSESSDYSLTAEA